MKTITAFAIIVVLAHVSGCELPSGDTPESIAQAYLDAQLHGRHEEVYALLSSRDKAVKSQVNFTRDNSGPKNPMAVAFLDRISFDIQPAEVSGDRATVTYLVTLPDFSVLMSAAVSSSLSSLGNGEDAQASALAEIAEKYSDKDLPTTTSSEVLELVMEEGRWRVFEDLQGKAQAKALRRKVSALREEAHRAEMASLHEEALAKYRELLELEPTHEWAAAREKKLVDTLAAEKAARAYLPKVTLYELTSQYYKTYTDEKLPGVEFKLKNTGDKALSKVQVVVYFKDADGKVIAEERYIPVLAGGYTRKAPLQPGYIWQIESGKFLTAKSVPSEWKEGSVEAKVTSVEFVQ